MTRLMIAAVLSATCVASTPVLAEGTFVRTGPNGGERMVERTCTDTGSSFMCTRDDTYTSPQGNVWSSSKNWEGNANGSTSSATYAGAFGGSREVNNTWYGRGNGGSSVSTWTGRNGGQGTTTRSWRR